MPSRELADRKRKLVNQFNTYVNLKKQHSSTEQGRGELLAGAASGQDEAAGGGAATDGKQLCQGRTGPLNIPAGRASAVAVSCTSVTRNGLITTSCAQLADQAFAVCLPWVSTTCQHPVAVAVYRPLTLLASCLLPVQA